VQAIYGYDVRTEIVGSKGSVFVGSLRQAPVALLTSQGSSEPVADQFLMRFADAYLAEVRDYVQSMLADRAPRVSREDGLKALEIAVAAEKSCLESRPCQVGSTSAEHPVEALPLEKTTEILKKYGAIK